MTGYVGAHVTSQWLEDTPPEGLNQLHFCVSPSTQQASIQIRGLNEKMDPDPQMGLSNVGWKYQWGHWVEKLGWNRWDSGSERRGAGIKRWSGTTQAYPMPRTRPARVPCTWALAGVLLLLTTHTHTHTHIHTRAHTSLLFILILRDALGIGPKRQMACFLLLLCLSIFCFPTSCDEGGNHAPHCILIRLDVLKEEREWAKRSPLYFSWATTLPDKCSSFPRACTPIDFPSIRIPQALPAS